MMGSLRIARISTGGQIFIPSEIRRRWGVREVILTDLGQRLLVEPIAASGSEREVPSGLSPPTG